jgi:hypothetical protein
VDLEVLPQLRLVRRGDRERRQEVEVHVGLPGGVLRMLDERLATEELGEPAAVERPAGARAPARARDARAERGVHVAGAVGVAERRVRVGE